MMIKLDNAATVAVNEEFIASDALDSIVLKNDDVVELFGFHKCSRYGARFERRQHE